MAYKVIVNMTSSELTDVTVIPRKGDDPANSGDPIPVGDGKIGPEGDVEHVIYGDDENPYLNGISVTVVNKDNGSTTTITKTVTTRGDEFDNILNTNDHVSIEDASGIKTSGSNG